MESSNNGMLNRTKACKANSGGNLSSPSQSHQEHQAREANSSTATSLRSSDSSPSDICDAAVPSSSAGQDSRSSLDRESPSQYVAASSPSTAPEGACWNPGHAQFDDSSHATWADCNTDSSVFTISKLQQAGATVINNTAHLPQGGQAYASGRGISTGTPDATIASEPSGSSSLAEEHSLEAYPPGIWNSTGCSEEALPTFSELTPEMVKVVLSDDGWGHTPIYQDIPWPEPENAKIHGKKNESTNMWKPTLNNGTAIWDNFQGNTTTGASASSYVASSWQDRRGSIVGDRSAPPWPTASTGRGGPSGPPWGDNSVNSRSAFDPQLWNAGDAGGRIRNHTSLALGNSSTVEARYGAISGQGPVNSDGSHDSLPGGLVRDWSSGVISRPLRPGESKFSQPGWQEDLQDHHWSHELQQAHSFLGPTGPGISRQQSQPVSRVDIGRVDIGGSGSPMQWEKPQALGRSSGTSGLGPPADVEWDASSSAVGAGSYPWPISDPTLNSQRPPKLMLPNRDEAGAEFAGGPRRPRYSIDSAMPAGCEIGEWGSRTASASGRVMTSGSKQGHGHGSASKSNVGASFAHQVPMRQQMLQTLCDMGFSKGDAQKALIDNGMDLNLAMADLNRSVAGSQQGNHQTVPRPLLAPQNTASTGGLMAAPFQAYPGVVNTHGSNAQSASTVGGKSFMHVPSGRQPQSIAPLPGAVPTMHLQPLGSQSLSAAAPVLPFRNINGQQALQGIKALIQHKYISPNAVKDQNVTILEEMLRLYTLYQSCQQTARSVSQMSSQQREQLDSINQKLTELGRWLSEPQQRLPTILTPDVAEDLIKLHLNKPYIPRKSKLPQWKMTSESEPGVLSQAGLAPGSKPVLASGTQAGCGTAGEDAWPVGGLSRPKLDANHNESQLLVDDFQIPEFVPGQMWTGGTSITADDAQLPSSSNTFFGGSGSGTSDENGGGGWSPYTSVQRSMSVPGGVWPPTGSGNAAAGTAASSASGRTAVGADSGDGSWSAAAQQRSGALVAPTRPPPGLVNYGIIGQSAGSSGGYGRRSSTSASWSPSTAGASVSSSVYPMVSHWEQLGSQWVALNGLPAHTDQARLRALCGQHGVVLAFHTNSVLCTSLVQYRSAQEAANAQSNLHCCVIANSTIHAQVVGEEEAKAFVDRSLQGSVTASGGLHPMSAWSTGAPAPAVATPFMWSTGGASLSAPGLGGIHLSNLWPGGAAGVDGNCL